jgi:hypothetical protein
MKSQILLGVEGNLYDPDSRACHFALEQLREVLVRLGFKVVKKLPSESTLRVYPQKIQQPAA